MKISIVTSFFLPEINGVSIAVFYRVKELLKNNIECQLILPDYESDEQEKIIGELTAEGCTITAYETKYFKKDNPKLPSRKSKVKINKALGKFSPEILIVDDPMTFFLHAGFVPLGDKEKIKAFAICHSDIYRIALSYKYYLAAPMMKIIPYFVYRKYAATIFPSRYLRSKYGIVRNKIRVPFLGVDKKRFFPEKEKNSQDEFTILTVSRISPDKGIKFLFECAEMINDKYPKARWFFIGSGPEYDYWKKKETGRISFIGSVPNSHLNTFYNRSNIFVSACDFEAFGLSIAEAMAAGLPVLVPSTGGASEKFTPKESGFIYDAYDHKSFIRELSHLIENETLRLNAGSKAVGEIQSWEDVVKELQQRLEGYKYSE